MNSRRLIAPAVVAVLAAATWLAWMGWDHEYQVDASGSRSGPYEAWQVAGCVLSLAVLTAAGTLFVRPWLTALCVTLAFTAAFVVTEAPRADGTGLWVVGAMLVFAGLAAGSAVVAYTVHLVRTLLNRA